MNGSPDLEAVAAKIEQAILADLRPVKPLLAARWRVLSLVALTALSIALITWFLHAYGWRRMNVWQASVTSSIFAGLVLITASAVSAQMAPGSRHWLSTRVLFGFGLTTLPVAMVVLFRTREDKHFAINAAGCFGVGIGCALFTAMLLWVAIRRGVPLSPRVHAASVSLLAGLGGIGVLELHCPLMDASHKLLGHGTVAIAAALVGYFLLFRKRPEKIPAP